MPRGVQGLLCFDHKPEGAAMNVTIPCLLVFLVSAAKAPARMPLQISVVEYPSGVLVGNAEVAIYAPNGLCIRRGQTQLFGHPFDAEAVEPLDPKLKELRVMVQKRQGYTVARDSATLVFEKNTWRAKEKPPQPPTPARERLTQEGPPAHLAQFPTFSDTFAEIAPVEIWLRLSPLPVCRAAPWQAFVCGSVPCAPPGPPCGFLPPVPPGEAWLPSSLPASGDRGTASLDSAHRREAAIAESGRPPVSEFPWATFGSRWVAGPHGMFWQARMSPANPKQTKSSDRP